MRTVYQRRLFDKTGRKIKFRLRRNWSQRWHLIRTMNTQLFTHERIEAIDAQAAAVQHTAERTIQLAKKYVETENPVYFSRMHKYLTTRYAIEKLYREILPRLENKSHKFITHTSLNKFRKGDQVQMGRVEINFNEIQKAEWEAGKSPELYVNKKKAHRIQLLESEKEDFAMKLEQVNDVANELTFQFDQQEINDKVFEKKCQMVNQKRDFFQKQIDRCDYELYYLQRQPNQRKLYATF